jgi:SAM-dependent methyltransferase
VGKLSADIASPREEATPSKAEASCPLCGASLPEATITGSDRLFGLPGKFDISVCTQCGAGVTLPVLSGSQLAALYPDDYDAYVTASGDAMSFLLRVYHAWRDPLTLHTPPLSLLRRTRPGRLLDVGCGKGEPSRLLIRHGWHVVGIDPSPDACKLARARGIDARLGTLQTVELEAEPFDAVLFHHSLEHVSDPLDDLRRAARLLRPGGTVLVSVPNFGCWQRRVFGKYWMALDLPRHRLHFTGETLTRALEECGFRGCSSSTQTSFSILPVTLQFATLGRPLFRGTISRRLMMGVYVVLYPFSVLAALLGRGGDVLTVVATRPDVGATPASSR